MKKLVAFAPWLVVPAFAFAAACSSSSSSGTSTDGDAGTATDDGGASGTDSGTSTGSCSAYSPPSGTDLTTPTVSFRADVLPIFQASCAKTNCHAFPGDPQHFNLYLGLADANDAGPEGSSTPGTASAIVGELVGVDSSLLASMPRVTASDPSQSFLMHKVDGDQCLFDTKCDQGDCGSQMP